MQLIIVEPIESVSMDKSEYEYVTDFLSENKINHTIDLENLTITIPDGVMIVSNYVANELFRSLFYRWCSVTTNFVVSGYDADYDHLCMAIRNAK